MEFFRSWGMRTGTKREATTSTGTGTGTGGATEEEQSTQGRHSKVQKVDSVTHARTRTAPQRSSAGAEVEAEKRKQANSARSARRRQAKLDAAKGIKRSRGGQVRPAEQIKSGSLRRRVYRRVEAAAAAAATAVEDLASTD